MTSDRTPGYNCRLTIWFDTTTSGRRLAYYWSYAGMRAIRIGLAAAEGYIAQGQADQIDGHPLRPRVTP